MIRDEAENKEMESSESLQDDLRQLAMQWQEAADMHREAADAWSRVAEAWETSTKPRWRRWIDRRRGVGTDSCRPAQRRAVAVAARYSRRGLTAGRLAAELGHHSPSNAARSLDALVTLGLAERWTGTDGRPRWSLTDTTTTQGDAR